MRDPSVQDSELARVLRALGHPIRLRIVRLLGSDARAVSWLAERTGQARPSMSQHLSLLRLHGVVVENRRGRRVFYRLTDPRVAEWLERGPELFVESAADRAPATRSAAEESRAADSLEAR